MRLIDADALLYEDIDCTDGSTYMVVHAPEIDNAPVAFDLESVIEQIEKRKDYLLKEFLLAEKDLSVKKNADARINEIYGIIEILKSAVNATDGKNGG